MLPDLEREFIAEKPERVKRLGIDEIAIVKGQKNYYAIFVNLDTGHRFLGKTNRRGDNAIGKNNKLSYEKNTTSFHII